MHFFKITVPNVVEYLKNDNHLNIFQIPKTLTSHFRTGNSSCGRAESLNDSYTNHLREGASQGTLRRAPLPPHFGNATLGFSHRLVSKMWRARLQRRRTPILRKDRPEYVNKYLQIVIVCLSFRYASTGTSDPYHALVHSHRQIAAG
ncbi:hypothetical protein TNCV_2969361 [Trichonephila clavipes]|nr:hypothetical protein TNCV_2969361 [Trichonephila clavipes]